MTLSRGLIFNLMFLAGSCFGIANDDNQTIIIESDIAERNEKTGLTQYSGNVIILA